VVLRGYAEEFSLKPPISMNILMPIRGTFDTLYLDILENIGTAKISEAVKTIKKPSSGEISKTLKEIMQDERLSKIVLRSPEEFERYLFMSASARELRNMGAARGIQTSSDKLRILRGILNLLTNTIYSRVILWIDDAERLGDMTGRDLADFQVFIRDLLDYVPLNLNIILNFTLTPGQKVEDIIVFLGDALRSRLYLQIKVEELTEEDFLEYVRDLLNFCRPRGAKVPDPYYPFEEKTLTTVFSMMKKHGYSVIPRSVNNILSLMLERASRDRTRKSIDVEFASRAFPIAASKETSKN